MASVFHEDGLVVPFASRAANRSGAALVGWGDGLDAGVVLDAGEGLELGLEPWLGLAVAGTAGVALDGEAGAAERALDGCDGTTPQALRVTTMTIQHHRMPAKRSIRSRGFIPQPLMADRNPRNCGHATSRASWSLAGVLPWMFTGSDQLR